MTTISSEFMQYKEEREREGERKLVINKSIQDKVPKVTDRQILAGIIHCKHIICKIN